MPIATATPAAIGPFADLLPALSLRRTACIETAEAKPTTLATLALAICFRSLIRAYGADGLGRDAKSCVSTGANGPSLCPPPFCEQTPTRTPAARGGFREPSSTLSIIRLRLFVESLP